MRRCERRNFSEQVQAVRCTRTTDLGGGQPKIAPPLRLCPTLHKRYCPREHGFGDRKPGLARVLESVPDKRRGEEVRDASYLKTGGLRNVPGRREIARRGAQ